MNAETIAQALGKPTHKTGGGFMACCPVHPDKNPSLSIDDTESGGVLVKCMAGCQQDAVVSALKDRDLWPGKGSAAQVKSKVVARYDYHGPDGTLLYWKERIEPGRNGRSKEFRFYHGEKQTGRGGDSVLYNLPDVLTASTVFICEGERKADVVKSWGLVGTSLDSGANSAITADMIAALSGKHIAIIPDNDEPGRAYADKIGAALAGKAASIKLVQLDGLLVKGDIVDWIKTPGNDKTRLLDLAQAAPEIGSGPAPDQEHGRDDYKKWPDAISFSELDKVEPQPPSFIIPDWLPCGYATLFAGHGGIGKSALALFMAVCMALGLPFFGMPVERRRVLYLSCEDRVSVLHWRLSRICAYLGIKLVDLNGWLDIIDLVGHETIVYQPGREGVHLTGAYRLLSARMKECFTQVLMVDGISDTYDGNENARAEVKAYVNSLLALIPPDVGAVLLIGHIDKQSAKGGGNSEGYSGSTAWNNAVRARWYLYPETRTIEGGRTEATGKTMIELQKSNLGPTGSAMSFEWDDTAKLFVGQINEAESKFDKNHREREEQAKLLSVLIEVSKNSFIPAASMGNRTAFHVLSVQPNFPSNLLNGAHGRKRFWRHIEQLRSMGMVKESSIQRENRHKTLILTPTDKAISACVDASNDESEHLTHIQRMRSCADASNDAGGYIGGCIGAPIPTFTEADFEEVTA